MVIPIKQHRKGILLTILKQGFAEKAKKNESLSTKILATFRAGSIVLGLKQKF